MSIEIVPVAAAHKLGWLPLWHGYLEFYEHILTDAQTELTWNRLIDPHFNIHGFVALDGDRVVGFTNYSFTHSTWEARQTIYLEDLFVDPELRGGGIGRALIEAVTDVARREGMSKVYWLTQETNATARKLYDSLATVIPFVRYERSVE
jgi:GNAT superfamily N-acetyltransferase